MKQKGLDTSSIKAKNRQILYKFIHSNDGVSRQDIARELRLSLPTVISNIEYLQENNLIDFSDEMQSTGGRKASTYVIKKRTRMAVGLYLTKHHIHAVTVDLAGNVVNSQEKEILFNLDDDAYLQELAESVEYVRAKSNIKKEELLGVGIALPGILSEDNETVLIGESMKFTGKTKEQITKYIGYDCRLIHDSYAAVFAETWKNFQTENAFYIGLNNYIGGAAVIGGHIYNGNNNHCGEIGHVKIAVDAGKRCYCGKIGCFETVCAATVLSELADNDLDKFFQKVKAKEDVAVKAWNVYLSYLAKAIGLIRLLFDSTVIIGGYVGARIGDYMEQLFELIDEEAFFGDKAANYVRQCKYTIEDAGAGAALLFIDDFINNI